MNITVVKAFEGLFTKGKHRYKAFHGGRGGGKTINFAIVLLTMAMEKKIDILCAREVQKSISKSVHKNLKDLIESYKEEFGGIWLGWDVKETYIRYSNGSEFSFIGLKDSTVDSIKSYANYNYCWVEEAHSISNNSLRLLAPTIRADNSEIWFSFNRETENDPVYEKYCTVPQDDVLVVEVNYYDNPYFNKVLETERQRDLMLVEQGVIEMEEYEHTWLGHPKSFMQESYYGKCIRKAEEEKRICRSVFEELLQVHTVWDIGVGDATAIWFFQVYGKEIRLIDYFESSGEGIPYYIDILKEKGYRYGSHFAPHDIAVREFSTGQSRIEAAHKLGLDFNIIPANSIMEGIHIARLNFHRCWFEAEKTQYGLKCLKNYRKQFDEKRQIYSDKPLHDWTSHCADAWRYLFYAVYSISQITGYHKTNAEFDDDYTNDCQINDNINNITGY